MTGLNIIRYKLKTYIIFAIQKSADLKPSAGSWWVIKIIMDYFYLTLDSAPDVILYHVCDTTVSGEEISILSKVCLSII